MVIHIENGSLVRDKTAILKNINWEVKVGEHWAILGLNGSGKTSLLNLITGYIWPTTGELTVLGETFGHTDLRELRKSIGWVSSAFQEKLYSEDTAEEIIVSGKFASVGLYEEVGPADFERANAILEQLNCSRLAKRSYGTLSQGEKQKVLIGRALMSSPRLLILDEPCTGLDIFARERLFSVIRRLAGQPSAPTLLYVTHHLEEILPLFSHTLLLRRAEIFSSGKTKKLLTTENLSAFFEQPVEVQWQHERIYLRIMET